jgi:hypothetical protein
MIKVFASAGGIGRVQLLCFSVKLQLAAEMWKRSIENFDY